MAGPVTTTYYDYLLEEQAMRRHGLLGRGTGMGNALFAIDHDSLPPEAQRTIELIIAGGPFPYPGRDGVPFGNRFGDLPTGRYLEYTVPTPGAATRGARRIVARLSTAQLFFTACHYERVQVSGGTADQRLQERLAATAREPEAWRNGFYLITGLTPDLRSRISQAIKAVS